MYSTSIFFFSTTVYNDYNGYPCVEAVVPSSCARYTQRCRELLSAAKVSSRFVSRVIGHERNSMRSLLVSDLLRNVRPRRAATGRAQMRSHVLRLVRSPVVRDEQRFARIAVNTNERARLVCPTCRKRCWLKDLLYIDVSACIVPYGKTKIENLSVERDRLNSDVQILKASISSVDQCVAQIQGRLRNKQRLLRRLQYVCRRR